MQTVKKVKKLARITTGSMTSDQPKQKLSTYAKEKMPNVFSSMSKVIALLAITNKNHAGYLLVCVPVIHQGHFVLSWLHIES